jgi:hypothetical protein
LFSPLCVGRVADCLHNQYKIVVLGSGGVGMGARLSNPNQNKTQQQAKWLGSFVVPHSLCAGKSAITVQFVQGVFVEKCECSPTRLLLPVR